MTEREFALEVVQRLRSAGYQALWAGGCVRDELLGLVPKDYDVATDARPEEVRRLFRRTLALGMSFGVVQVLGPRTATGYLSVEVATFRQMAGQIPVVSAERSTDELRQLLVHPRRARAVAMLMDLGLVAAILPELLAMKGLPQGPPNAPTGDLWEHVLSVLDLLGPDPSFPLALATLLHDVGKPRTVGRTPDKYTFYYHEHVGRRLASDLCLRLKLSTAERERVEWLVEKHQFLCEARAMRTSKLKVTLNHPGIRELLALH